MSGGITVLNGRPKYPPIQDGNRVAYLLLHVCIPSNISPAPSVRHLNGIKSAQRAGKILGIKIWPLRVTWENKRGCFRYFLRFPRYRRDDQQAQRIGECFLSALALASGPFIAADETASVFRVPAEVVRNTHIVPVDKLLQIEEARPDHSRALESPYTLIRVHSTTGDHFDAAWEMTPVLLENEELCRAVQLLKTSQDNFFIWPGQIDEVLGSPELTAAAGFDQIRLEGALQSAFKTIEAILGDPPKDSNKFFAKLRSIGLDPNEEVGYAKSAPVHEVIRKMNTARDKKAAHGSTSHRIITIGEMMEYQACARLVVWAAIESKLSASS